jgi:hypothetical protein
MSCAEDVSSEMDSEYRKVIPRTGNRRMTMGNGVCVRDLKGKLWK